MDTMMDLTMTNDPRLDNLIEAILRANELNLAPDWAKFLLDLKNYNTNRTIATNWRGSALAAVCQPSLGLSAHTDNPNEFHDLFFGEEFDDLDTDFDDELEINIRC
jgi:hypothetical protein